MKRTRTALAVATVMVTTQLGFLAAAPAAHAATGIAVSVGYADSLRPSPNLPVPWQGSPNINFIGDNGPWDAGAVRLDNPTSSPITVDSVVVDLQRPGPTFNLWGSFTIPANGSAILTQTARPENFDTSDFPITPCGQTASPSDPRIPKVTVTIGGVATSFLDTGHILDTGGFDSVCLNNESLAWRPIGTAGPGTANATVTLAPPTQTVPLGTNANTTATVLDAFNQPLANVAVNFAVTTGPNAGTTGSAITDALGNATFFYTSSTLGTDTVQATVPNASGGSFSSNTVNVVWVTPNHPPSCSSATVSSGELWPPNHKLQTVTINGVVDPDPGDTVTINITGVTSDEPTNGLGDGDTPVDAVITPNSKGVQLRAERQGTGDGRVYVIHFTATDNHGATCTGTVTVSVPHDQKPGQTAVDSGQAYDATMP